VADLQLTSAVLSELEGAFAGFAASVQHACGDIVIGDGLVQGEDPLSGDVHAFAGSWNYGLGQLGRHGDECTRMLRQVGSAFDQLDQRLAREVTIRKEEGR
jgi:hypothetical protein